MTYEDVLKEIEILKPYDDAYQEWLSHLPYKFLLEIAEYRGLNYNNLHKYINELEQKKLISFVEECNIIGELFEIGVFKDNIDRELLSLIVGLIPSTNLKYRWLDKLL